MDVTTHTLPARTVGRYLVARPEARPEGLLVGFHGYGESAERHLEDLRRIPGSDRWICVAVFALHRFYNTRTQEVIGSWMTRLDREAAIAGNIAYVADVVRAAVALDPEARRLVYAGFSQGASMAYRAAAFAGHACDGLIALGGDVPPDVRDDASVRLPPVLLGRGTTDQWYSADKLQADIAALERLSRDTQVLVFEGGHEWTDAFWARAGRFLANLA
jgi:predicted esterase